MHGTFWTLQPQKFNLRSITSQQVGWKHQEAVKTLEEARKVRSSAYYQAKKKLNALRAKAAAQVDET